MCEVVVDNSGIGSAFVMMLRTASRKEQFKRKSCRRQSILESDLKKQSRREDEVVKQGAIVLWVNEVDVGCCDKLSWWGGAWIEEDGWGASRFEQCRPRMEIT